MLVQSFVSLLAVAASTASASPVHPRAIVNHDSINPWPENVPGTATGNALKKFEPYLHIAHGCQPYSAVDGYGNISGGLQDTGSSSGGCKDQSKGQTYVRGGWHKGRYGIMYAWYFPKDMPTDGVSVGAHRHDWENVVIWVDNPAASDPKLLGAAASGHGTYKKTTSPQVEGTRPKVEYFTSFPTNHELQFSNTLGRDLPMMWYEFFPQVTKDALEHADFGKANVPFTNAAFQSNLEKAWV